MYYVCVYVFYEMSAISNAKESWLVVPIFRNELIVKES